MTRLLSGSSLRLTVRPTVATFWALPVWGASTYSLGRRHSYKEHFPVKSGDCFPSFPLPLRADGMYCSVQHCIKPLATTFITRAWLGSRGSRAWCLTCRNVARRENGRGWDWFRDSVASLTEFNFRNAYRSQGGHATCSEDDASSHFLKTEYQKIK